MKGKNKREINAIVAAKREGLEEILKIISTENFVKIEGLVDGVHADVMVFDDGYVSFRKEWNLKLLDPVKYEELYLA